MDYINVQFLVGILFCSFPDVTTGDMDEECMGSHCLLLTACESVVISKTKGINYLKTKTPLRSKKMKSRISIVVKKTYCFQIH